MPHVANANHIRRTSADSSCHAQSPAFIFVHACPSIACFIRVVGAVVGESLIGAVQTVLVNCARDAVLSCPVQCREIPTVTKQMSLSLFAIPRRLTATYLDEANVGGAFSEALTANVQPILADETSAMRADTATHELLVFMSNAPLPISIARHCLILRIFL